VVCSVSLNVDEIVRRYERGTDNIRIRMEFLRRMSKEGVEVRARIDPVVMPWELEEAYQGLVDELASEVEELRAITLGVLRASTTRLLGKLPGELTQMFVRGGWGWTYPWSVRERIYRTVIERAEEYGIRVGLCKEPPKMWRAVGAKGPCNCLYFSGNSVSRGGV